jgi:hypothetical protein
MGMGEPKRQSVEYALRVQRLLQAVKDLEECAFEFPEKRDETVYLLDNYSDNSKESGKFLKRAADEVAAVGMLEILHEA